MSKKREFPILNGKLISDLDANGHKIIGADIEVPAEKIKEAVAPELEAKADKTELEAETQRATGVEATLGNAITAEAQRAQEAEAALRGTVDGKVDKVANATSGTLAALDSNGNLADSGNMVAGAFAAGSFIGGGGGHVGFQLDSTSEGVELYVSDGGGKILKFPLREGTLAVQEDIAPTFDETGTYDKGALVFHDGLYQCVNPDGHTGAWVAANFAEATVEDVLAALRRTVAGKVDAVEGKGLSSNDYTNEDKEKLGTAYTPDNPPPAPDLSGYATKSEIPYSLIEVPLADRINLTDRAVNKVTADGSLNSIQFVFPEKKEGKSRDFFLRLVITGETVPTLSFSEPTGESVSFDSDNDSWANIEQGVNILMFTDTEA